MSFSNTNYSTFQGAHVYMDKPIVANTVRSILSVLNLLSDSSILHVRSIGMPIEVNDQGLKS